MPEGPEVTRVARQLHSIVSDSFLEDAIPMSGRYIKRVPDGYHDFMSALERSALLIKGVYNKGKFIWWEFENEWFLFSTLGMSGRYSLRKDTHSRVLFSLTKSYYNTIEYLDLYYSDIRNFGTLKFVNDRNILNKKLDSIGPDMLNNPCSVKNFVEIARKYNHKSIVSFLMNQKYISGIGNIYKSESLYLSGISPYNSVSDLSDNDLIRLHGAIIKILTESYKTGGSTIRTYKDLYGVEGSYSGSKHLVYNKKVDPNGNAITKVILDDKRTTYFSPMCQH